jgi:hypothetical protein
MGGVTALAAGKPGSDHDLEESMPSTSTTTRRRPRATAGQARFARGPARPPSRFARGGAPAPGRFARPSQRPAGRPTIVTRGRRQEQKPGGVKGMLAALPGVGGGKKRKRGSSAGGMKGLLAAVPGVTGGTKRRRSSSGGGRRKAGGAALLAGAAGLALKNREKVSSLLRDRKRDEDTSPGPMSAAGADATGAPAAADVTPADVAAPPPPPPAAGAADEPRPASRPETPPS